MGILNNLNCPDETEMQLLVESFIAEAKYVEMWTDRMNCKSQRIWNNFTDKYLIGGPGRILAYSFDSAEMEWYWEFNFTTWANQFNINSPRTSLKKHSSRFFWRCNLIDRGFGSFHKGITWIHFQSERTQASCSDKFVMEDEDQFRKDKGYDTFY